MGLLSTVIAAAAVAAGAPVPTVSPNAPPAQPLSYSELKAVDARMNGHGPRERRHPRRSPPRLRPTLQLPASGEPRPKAD